VHPENRFYGHGRVVARAAFGPDAPPIVRGYLQHGWSTGHGFGPPARHVSWLPRYGWGERTRQESAAAGLRGVTLIGAPFLYLSATVDPRRPKPRATVVYPFHGTEVLGTTGSHDRLADEIAEREDRPVTICLYWSDHTPDAVAVYERRGFTVTTHGHRLDQRFLERQLELLLQHDRIVTNRVGSAFWYGAVLGLEAEIYGPYFGFTDLAAVDPQLERFQRSEWPDFHDRPVPGGEAMTVAAHELGAAHVRPTAELAALVAPRGGPLRRRIERIAARTEREARRAVVHYGSRLPGGAALDATPLPSRLPPVDALDLVERVGD